MLQLYKSVVIFCGGIDKQCAKYYNEFMKKYTYEQLKEFARKLRVEQEKLEPHLTYDQMGKILGYQWDNSITRIMDRLVDAGLAKAVDFGEVGKKRYRIL